DVGLARFGEDASKIGFAHPEHLVSADELARSLGSTRLVILDVRPVERFSTGHIPSAQQVFRSDYSMLEPFEGPSKDAAALEKLLDEKGVKPDSIVVLYGDGGPEPYRLWWTLIAVARYSARVLD